MIKRISTKNRKILAIDFGSHTLKFVSGKVSKGVITIYKTLSIPIPPDIYNNGEVLNAKELGGLIKNTIVDNGLKKLPIICAVSGNNCMLRVLSLPEVKHDELMEMISYEIQQYLPVDAAQYIIEYAIIEGSNNIINGNKSILVGAIPRVFAESLLALFEGIELKPMGLDLLVHGFSKLVETFMQQPLNSELRTESILYVDLGHNQMDISLYEQGLFYMNRRVANCGMQLDQKIARVFDMSLQDARLEKQQVTDIGKASGDYSSEHRVQNVVQTAVDEWVSEVLRIMKFYSSRSSGKAISHVYLYGGSSQIKGLAAYFEKELGIPTECMVECETAVFETPIRENLAIYFNAIGALIRKEE